MLDTTKVDRAYKKLIGLYEKALNVIAIENQNDNNNKQDYPEGFEVVDYSEEDFLKKSMEKLNEMSISFKKESKFAEHIAWHEGTLKNLRYELKCCTREVELNDTSSYLVDEGSVVGRYFEGMKKYTNQRLLIYQEIIAIHEDLLLYYKASQDSEIYKQALINIYSQIIFFYKQIQGSRVFGFNVDDHIKYLENMRETCSHDNLHQKHGCEHRKMLESVLGTIDIQENITSDVVTFCKQIVELHQNLASYHYSQHKEVEPDSRVCLMKNIHEVKWHNPVNEGTMPPLPPPRKESLKENDNNKVLKILNELSCTYHSLTECYENMSNKCHNNVDISEFVQKSKDLEGMKRNGFNAKKCNESLKYHEKVLSKLNSTPSEMDSKIEIIGILHQECINAYKQLIECNEEFQTHQTLAIPPRPKRDNTNCSHPLLPNLPQRSRGKRKCVFTRFERRTLETIPEEDGNNNLSVDSIIPLGPTFGRV